MGAETEGRVGECGGWGIAGHGGEKIIFCVHFALWTRIPVELPPFAPKGLLVGRERRTFTLLPMRFRLLFSLVLPLLAGVPPLRAQTSLQATGPYRWVLTDLNRLPSEEVVALAQDEQENRYYATRKGLTIEDKSDNFHIYTRASTRGALTSDSLTCMVIDRYRDLWIGTDGGGLNVFSGGGFRSYTKEGTRGGLPDDAVLALASYREAKWIGTRNGFAVLRGGAWTTYTGNQISGRLPHPAVSAIAVDSSGDAWMGTLGGLVRLAGSVWTRFNIENTQGGLPHNGITALYVDGRNGLWVGTQTGLARRAANGEWVRFAGGSGLRNLAQERVISITPGFDGDVWVSFRGGAARFTGGQWELYSRDNVPGLLTLYVNYVLAGPNGVARIATQKGVISRLPVSVVVSGEE
jgi:ligand-binding sensor domain-containing protein